eukprot:g4022.t1
MLGKRSFLSFVLGSSHLLGAASALRTQAANSDAQRPTTGERLFVRAALGSSLAAQPAAQSRNVAVITEEEIAMLPELSEDSDAGTTAGGGSSWRSRLCARRTGKLVGLGLVAVALFTGWVCPDVASGVQQAMGGRQHAVESGRGTGGSSGDAFARDSAGAARIWSSGGEGAKKFLALTDTTAVDPTTVASVTTTALREADAAAASPEPEGARTSQQKNHSKSLLMAVAKPALKIADGEWLPDRALDFHKKTANSEFSLHMSKPVRAGEGEKGELTSGSAETGAENERTADNEPQSEVDRMAAGAAEMKEQEDAAAHAGRENGKKNVVAVLPGISFSGTGTDEAAPEYTAHELAQAGRKVAKAAAVMAEVDDVRDDIQRAAAANASGSGSSSFDLEVKGVQTVGENKTTDMLPTRAQTQNLISLYNTYSAAPVAETSAAGALSRRATWAKNGVQRKIAELRAERKLLVHVVSPMAGQTLRQADPVTQMTFPGAVWGDYSPTYLENQFSDLSLSFVQPDTRENQDSFAPFPFYDRNRICPQLRTAKRRAEEQANAKVPPGYILATPDSSSAMSSGSTAQQEVDSPGFYLQYFDASKCTVLAVSNGAFGSEGIAPSGIRYAKDARTRAVWLKRLVDTKVLLPAAKRARTSSESPGANHDLEVVLTRQGREFLESELYDFNEETAAASTNHGADVAEEAGESEDTLSGTASSAAEDPLSETWQRLAELGQDQQPDQAEALAGLQTLQGDLSEVVANCPWEAMVGISDPLKVMPETSAQRVVLDKIQQYGLNEQDFFSVPLPADGGCAEVTSAGSGPGDEGVTMLHV